MKIKCERVEGITICRIEGDLNFATSPELRKALIKLIKNEPKSLALDLSELDSMDSAGLATIIEAMENMQSHRGKLSLIGANESVRRVFALGDMEERFQLLDSEEEAVGKHHE